MWDNITSPVIECLSKSDGLSGKLDRLIWCPTGALSFLPLHAAGYHREEMPRTVMDQLVSSYTATIRSLKYSKSETNSSDEVKFLIATVTRRELMTAETEAKIARKTIVSFGAREENVVLLKKIFKGSFV